MSGGEERRWQVCWEGLERLRGEVQVQSLSWEVGTPSVYPSMLRVGTRLRWVLLSVWAWNQVGWEVREGCAQCCCGE